jgi:SAM-dependent methyltransferase
MSNPPLTQNQIEKKLTTENLDELLHLWWMEQGGAAKRRDLELMATALPFSAEQRLRVLDLCCGPGDVGRSIWARYPHSRIDSLDRDLFLISMCIELNRREGVPGETFVRDLWNSDWCTGLPRDYDIVATANALHRLDARRVEELFRDVSGLLRSGGVFLFVEPACAEKAFAGGFSQWKSRQPPRYVPQNWERFWSRANAILGYDHAKLHTKLPGSRDAQMIRDEEMPVSGWIQLLRNASFDSIDVLLRDADEVILAATKP